MSTSIPHSRSIAGLTEKRRQILQRMGHLAEDWGKNKPPSAKAQVRAREHAEFELLESEVQRIREQIRELEGNEPEAGRRARYRAFVAYLRRGLYPDRNGRGGISREDRELLIPAMGPRESRDMSEGLMGGAYPNSQGGFFAPVLFADAVAAALRFHSDCFAYSTIVSTSIGTPLGYPNMNDTAAAGVLVAENQQTPAQDVGQGQVTFSSYKISSQMIKASIELVQDAYAGFEDWLIQQFAIRIARGISPYLLLGTGPNTNPPEPTGIITAATNSGQTVVGNDNAVAPNPSIEVGYKDLLNLEGSVDVLYRRRGSYLMHDQTFQYLKNLRDDAGRPLRESMGILEEPDPDRPGMTRCYLNGHRVFFDDAMDQLGPYGSPLVGSKSVAFGDLSKYVIRRMRALTVLRLTDRYADFGQVGFLAWDRLDGNLLAAGLPVKYLQNAA